MAAKPGVKSIPDGENQGYDKRDRLYIGECNGTSVYKQHIGSDGWLEVIPEPKSNVQRRRMLFDTCGGRRSHKTSSNTESLPCCAFSIHRDTMTPYR
jgi:hypothetical protein